MLPTPPYLSANSRFDFPSLGAGKENLTPLALPTKYSSSPLASSSSTSSSSSSPFYASSCSSAAVLHRDNQLPTPPTSLKSSPISKSASSSGSRKQRITWDLIHRRSCASSPKHRYHPYSSPAVHASSPSSPARLAATPLSLVLGSPSSGTNTGLYERRQQQQQQQHRQGPRSILSVRAKRALAAKEGSASLAVSSFQVTASSSLAEITKANGGGRQHTTSFPDLQGAREGLAAGFSTRPAPAANGMQPSGLISDAQPPAPEGSSAVEASLQASAVDADPRKHIISALHTLRASLDCVSHAPSADETEKEDEDCFISQPVDFVARPLQRPAAPPATNEPSSSTVPPLPVHLRELEGAYSTIFTYAQAYLHQLASSSSPLTQRGDDLDKLFTSLSTALLDCLERDITNALHPVPIVERRPEPSSVPSTKAVRQMLITGSRPALAALNAMANGDNIPSSPSASSSPGLAAPSSSSPVASDSGRPKKFGRTTAEIRRRRGELNTAEAAIQCMGAMLSCECFWASFEGQSRDTRSKR